MYWITVETGGVRHILMDIHYIVRPLSSGGQRWMSVVVHEATGCQWIPMEVGLAFTGSRCRMMPAIAVSTAAYITGAAS